MKFDRCHHVLTPSECEMSIALNRSKLPPAARMVEGKEHSGLKEIRIMPKELQLFVSRPHLLLKRNIIAISSCFGNHRILDE
jgi:hypothetical protein